MNRNEAYVAAFEGAHTAGDETSRARFLEAHGKFGHRTGDAQVRHVDQHTFDRIAVTYDDVVQEQLAAFIEARWSASRLETVVVERNGVEIAAAAVVVLAARPFARGGMAILKWGPLWRTADTAADVERLRHAVTALKRYYVNERAFHLTVMPHADPVWAADTVAILERCGFRQAASLPLPERYLVNVGIGAEELRASLDQKWRYNLKKALKEDFEFCELVGREGLGRFMALYDTMSARKNFKDTSAIDTLPGRLQTACDATRPRLFMLRCDGTDTAGAVVDMFGDRAVYLYGATDDRALPLKAGYALHWHIAEQLCAMPRPRWYDLGGADNDRGLHQFKKGFVGKSGSIEMTPPSYQSCDAVSSAIMALCVYGLRDLKARATDLRYRFGP